MEHMFKIAELINALRARRGDKTIGTQVEAGKYRMVSSVYGKGIKTTVTPLSDWMAIDQYLAFVTAQ